MAGSKKEKTMQLRAKDAFLNIALSLICAFFSAFKADMSLAEKLSEGQLLLQDARLREAIPVLESELKELESASGYFNLGLAEFKLSSNLSAEMSMSPRLSKDLSPIDNQLRPEKEAKNLIDAKIQKSKVLPDLEASPIANSNSQPASNVESGYEGKDLLLAKAYFHFLKARNLAPLNPEIKSMIQKIEKDKKAASFASKSWKRYATSIVDALSQRAILFCAAWMFSLASLFMLLSQLFHNKIIEFRFQLAGIVLLGLSVYFGAVAWKDDDLRQKWAVSTSRTVMKKLPNDSSDSMIDLSPLSAVKVIRFNSSWVFGELDSGQIGWVKKEYLYY